MSSTLLRCFNNGDGGARRAGGWVLIIVSARRSAALADAQTVMEQQTDASEMEIQTMLDRSV